MYPSLGEFVRALSRAGEVLRLSETLDPVLEIATLADRQSKLPAPNLPAQPTRRTDPRFHHLGGHALLCENVQGADLPVLINAYGSYHRMELALGCDASSLARQGVPAERAGLEHLASRLASLVKPEPPASLGALFAKAREFLPLLRIPPKRRRGSGPCQEIVLTGDDIDLTRLPILKCWPLDGDFAAVGYPRSVNDAVSEIARGPEWDARFRGRYITLGGIHTIHADDRDHPRPPSHNIGMYRVQLLGPRTLAMHWHLHHDGARHWRSWKARGEPMPVAVALGGESVLPYAATAPLPPGISELLLAGFLNGRGIEMVRAKTVPLWVPAHAEIIIEGYVRPEAGLPGWQPTHADAHPGPGAVFEGPFGDHTGFYSMPDRYPLFDVTAVTRRRDAIYHTTVVGLPPQEDYFLGKATERLFLPLLRTLIHDIDDYDLPLLGAFHNCAAVKIKKAYALQGRRVMHSVWGAGQMAWTKSIFVVDDDVDVHDTRAVLRAAAQRCHPVHGVETVNGPLDILDHAAPHLGAGKKIGFDATRTMPGEPGHAGRGDPHAPRGEASAAPLSAFDERVLLPCLRALPTLEDAVVHEGWLFLKVHKHQPQDGQRALDAVRAAIESGGAPPPPFIIALAGAVDLSDLDACFFHWLAHSDASRDAEVWSLRAGAALAFDATPKVPGDERHGQPVRAWPPIIAPGEAVVARLRDRFPQWFTHPAR